MSKFKLITRLTLEFFIMVLAIAMSAYLFYQLFMLIFLHPKFMLTSLFFTFMLAYIFFRYKEIKKEENEK